MVRLSQATSRLSACWGEDIAVFIALKNTLTVPGGMTGSGKLSSTAGPAIAWAMPTE